jgi:hypothetical protein
MTFAQRGTAHWGRRSDSDRRARGAVAKGIRAGSDGRTGGGPGPAREQIAITVFAKDAADPAGGESETGHLPRMSAVFQFMGVRLNTSRAAAMAPSVPMLRTSKGCGNVARRVCRGQGGGAQDLQADAPGPAGASQTGATAERRQSP